jgi:hypothetical protein
MHLPSFQVICEQTGFDIKCQLEEHTDVERFTGPTKGVGLYFSNGVIELHWSETTGQEDIVAFLRVLSEQALALAQEVEAA